MFVIYYFANFFFFFNDQFAVNLEFKNCFLKNAFSNLLFQKYIRFTFNLFFIRIAGKELYISAIFLISCF